MVGKMALDSFLYHCLGFTPSTALPFCLNYLSREGCTVAIFDATFPRYTTAISKKNKKIKIHCFILFK